MKKPQLELIAYSQRAPFDEALVRHDAERFKRRVFETLVGDILGKGLCGGTRGVTGYAPAPHAAARNL